MLTLSILTPLTPLSLARERGVGGRRSTGPGACRSRLLKPPEFGVHTQRTDSSASFWPAYAPRADSNASFSVAPSMGMG